MCGGGSLYSPRLVLSLIFELPPDSRYVAAQRDGGDLKGEWTHWGSVTFTNQLLASISNWSQAHTLGALNYEDGKKPEYSPINDPHESVVRKRPPTLEELNGIFFNT